RRIERELPRAVIVLARKGADAARALYPAQSRDRSVFHAMQAVNVDGHKFDVFVKWPDGEVGRPLMVAFQDLASNLIVSHRIDRSENREAVRLAIGDMIETHGIPDHVWMDNGRAFASKWISGRWKNRFRFKIKDDEPTGILTELGVTIHWTTPYSGQSKPIERAFRELAEEIARHPKCAGAYTGNRPDAKPENYGSAAIPIEAFETLVAAEIARFNLRAGRRTKEAGGKLSFADVYRASMARETTLVRKATAAQRRLFLMAAEGVTSRPRNGEIHLAGNRYWTEDLVEIAGRRVVARFDPQAMHQPLHVYTLDGRFVASAECIEATGFNDAAAARAHSALRAAYMRKLRDIRDLERLLTPEELAAMLPEAEAVALPAPKIVQMVRKAADPGEGRREAEDAFVRGAERLFGEVVKFGG
ncbi:MAG: transposase domain-containing protein, partial [Rhizobiaceae bacterium]